jgi:dihydroorotase
MTRISLIKPDDWHLHLRSGEAMKSVVGMSAAQMGRAIIMPNLLPPIKSVRQAEAYHKEIMKALPVNSDFSPLMVLYLTDSTDPKEIASASAAPEVYAAKLYPAGSTTNSDNGVTNITNIYPVLEEMQKEGFPLLVHGEVTDPEVDVFDRESAFIEKVLDRIVRDFPGLKIVLEHITTKDAVDYVLGSNDNIAATITPHHLLANRNHMLVGGIKPHYYCLPVLKRQNPDQRALLKAAISGNPKFFLGTDSAPHDRDKKESACGCAGIFSAHAAIELYAEAFDIEGAIGRLEGFASIFGPNFYGLPQNREKITLEKSPWRVPNHYEFAGSRLTPFFAGTELSWKLLS